MKTKLSILIISICWLVCGFGQSITCPWTTGDFPFETQSGDTYSWSKGIYFPTQLGGAQTFNKISFRIDSKYKSCTYTNIKIYLRNTGLNFYTTGVNTAYPGTSGFTQVYSGNFPYTSSGIVTLNLSTSFTYNALQNLELLVENQGGTSGYDSYGDGNQNRTDYNPGGYNFGVYGASNSSFSSATSAASPVPYNAAIVFNSNSTNCLIPLPVELTNFSAQCKENNGVELKWTTASEANTNFYEISRSRDGKSWEVIGKVDAVGNSSRELNYNYLDKNGLGTMYYQLRSEDFDGYTKTFPPISAVCDQKESQWNVFPVPSTDKINVNIYSPKEKEQIFTLLDMTGKIVLQRSLHLDEGVNLVLLNLDKIPEGVYTLIATDSPEFIPLRVMKVN